LIGGRREEENRRRRKKDIKRKKEELTPGKSETNRYSPRSWTWYWKLDSPNLESM